MDPKALDDIHRFTASVDAVDLFAYIGVERDADKAAITHALQVRRSWAQGQQANPKFRQEALWLIKNIQLVKSALTSDQSLYVRDLDARDERAKLETLSMFIKGTLADGDLTVRGEEAIQVQGEALGLPEAVVIRRIGEILAERDAGTLTAPPPPSGPIDLPDEDDLYAILDAPVDSTPPQLEEAYRQRYRWARQLRDTEKSSRIYSLIDEAWRVLQDPERRAAYDQERADRDSAVLSSAVVAEIEETEDRLAFLPPPPPQVSLSLPMPSVEKHLEEVLHSPAPAIEMPSSAPERAAPPPPNVPLPGEESDEYSVEVFDEAEVTADEPAPIDPFLEVPPLEPEPLTEELEINFDTQSPAEPDTPDTNGPERQGFTLAGSQPEEVAPTQPKPPTADGGDLGMAASMPTADLESMLASMVFQDSTIEATPEAPLAAPPNTAPAKQPTESPPPTEPDFTNFSELGLEGLDMGLSPKPETVMPSFDGLEGLVGATEFPDGDDLSNLNMGLMQEPLATAATADGLDLANDGPVLSAGQIYNDMAELKIEGPKVIRIRTGVHPFPVRITVTNAGAGPMPGTVSTGASWVQISPKMLDPDRKTQVVEVLVEPDGMPGNSAKAVITVEAEHGETRTVTIDALKHVVSPVTVLVAALAVVGTIGIFAALYFTGHIGSQLETPTRTILAVNIDPPAGEVYIDDVLVGNQGTMSLVDDFPIDTPFQLRVELDGFEPFAREVTVRHGDQVRIVADLALRDMLNFKPAPGMKEVTLDAEAIDAELESRRDHFDNCFTRNLRTTTPFTAEIEVNSTVTDRGFIHGVTFGPANFRSPAVETCLKRQLRALKLPLIPGDFGRFTRTINAEIRPVTALNEDDVP